MRDLKIDAEYVEARLVELLNTPSPTGFTDGIVHVVCEYLEELGVRYELTRRGAIRAELPGIAPRPDRAIVAHLDTLGAMVRRLRDDGRIEVAPIGHWSARFAEGARVTVFSDDVAYRGTLLPALASGHSYGDAIDTQPADWEKLELRVDARVRSRQDVEDLGVQIGDFVAIDPQPEITDTGYVVSRHLDDKAGVAALLGAIEAVQREGVELPLDCHPLFTISEEVGSGASHVLHRDVAEMVAIDNAPPSKVQNATEDDVTIPFMDSSGPFDIHLAKKLEGICKAHGISSVRDVFRYYRCDAASAVDAGNDIRTALVCFGVDASHGYERTRFQSILQLARLLALYIQSPPTFERDRHELGSLSGFPEPPEVLLEQEPAEE